MAGKGKGPVLGRVQSESNPNRSYKIRLGADHRVYCSCPAWRFSSGPVKQCKHIHAFRAAVA